MALDRAGLVALGTLDREEIALPGGDTVFVRCMSVAERARLAADIRKVGSEFSAPYIVAATACDIDGNLLFPDDPDAVGALPPKIVDPIIEAALRVNAMRDEDKEELGKGSPEIGTTA